MSVYLDTRYQAKGDLYLDDGQTFAARDHCAKTLMTYTFVDGLLSGSKNLDKGCFYDGAAYVKKVTQLQVYGVPSEPTAAIDLSTNQSVEFSYDSEL